MTKLEMINEMLSPKNKPQRNYAEDLAKKLDKETIEFRYNQFKKNQEN